jgi:hypothetical protein
MNGTKAIATKETPEVAIYHDKGWTSPFSYSTEQVK